MAKDNRVIVRGVRINDVVYKEEMEDELASVLDKKQISRLVDNGSLSGDWGTNVPTVKTAKK